jgi:hypothetical protein
MRLGSGASIAVRPALFGLLLLTTACAGTSTTATPQNALPRTPDGRPDLQGIWQAQNAAAADLEDHAARHNMRPGRSVVLTDARMPGGEIPYLPAALEQRRRNAAEREMTDPLSKCFMPGVPRIMYMPFPFQIYQTKDHVAMTFEWSQVYRIIYTNGSKPRDGIPFWMGDSRGRWEGDTLVVDVTNHNDRSWFDMAGNFHSDALKVVERYSLQDADTIQYEATIEDPNVFSRPWTMTMPLHRVKGMDRLLEYQCQAEAEEANGAFEREPKTWYPGPGEPPPPPAETQSGGN